MLARDGVVAYARRLGSEVVLIVLNSNRRPVTLDLPVEGHLEDSIHVRDVWENTTTKVLGGKLETIQVPARSGTALVAETGPVP